MASTLESALRLVKPGEMVVSLTDILNKLGDKITSAERDQLLIAMLSPRREKVQPGDLITSDLLNMVLADVADLQVRVANLEIPAASGKKTRIVELLPKETKHIGDTIHIIGEGFSVPSGTTVTIDGIGVQATPGVDQDRELVAVVPNVQGVTQAGKNVTLLVTNTQGTDMQDFIVFPAEVTIPVGQLFVALAKSPIEPQLEAGGSYTFTYNVQAIVNLDESYQLSASVDAGWNAYIVDSADNPISSVIKISAAPPPAGATQTVRVRVKIPDAVPNGTSGLLRLVVTSLRNPSKVSGQSGGESIVVNEAPPPPMDVAITLGEITRIVATQPVPTTSDGMVRIGATSANYRITFSAQIRADTVYTVEVVAPADAHWFASLSGSATPVLKKAIGPVASATNQPIYVFVHAQAGAPDAGITFSLTSTSDETKFGSIVQPIGLLP